METLDTLLLNTEKRLRQSEDINVIDEFASDLGVLYDHSIEHGKTQEFIAACRSSPLHSIILSDPYSRRAFEKPRGYAGDAVMLDYIYRPDHTGLNGLALSVHRATTELPNGQSIVWRRDYLAGLIVKALSCKRNARVLAVASGHMRELDVVRKRTDYRNLKIVALDQDRASLDVCVNSYRDFDIRPLNKSISSLMRSDDLWIEGFDLIYAAGLFDYLSDEIAIKLMQALDRMVLEKGTLAIGNFLPENHGRGFMAGFMDWSLVCRSEKDLEKLARIAAPGSNAHVFKDEPGNVAYVEITKGSLDTLDPTIQR